jgi:RND family efflux transporter MFP subunit
MASVATPATAVEFECLVEPKLRVQLSAPIEGVVETISVDRGERVAKGQVVAALESALEKANLDVARARAMATAELRGAEARRDFERGRFEQATGLFEKGMISDLQFDEASSDRLVAEAAAERAAENRELARLELSRALAALERRQIRSPIDGVVVKRLAAPGEYADPPQILELAQIDPLYIEVYAPVSLLDQIAVGSKGRVELEPAVGESYQASVAVVDPVVDPASGTFGVRLELPNPDGRLSAGVKCTVEIDTARAVPAQLSPQD